MKPKEKAIELVNKFIDYVNCWDDESADPNYTKAYNYAKQCALIAVNEIMEYLDVILLPNPFAQYWQEVKQEIEKL